MSDTEHPDEVLLRLRRDQAVSAFLPLFFVSGATSLVYQTLWGRQLHLVFGTSSFAITTVLAAFMAGLALGGLAMGRVADRIARPLRAYGVMEVVIGLYAVAFPTLLAALTPVYLGAWHALKPGPVAFGAIQLLLVGLALLLPTSLMGATLPLLARFATDRLGAAGDRIAILYAVNTAGAVFGTWFAGFVLLPGTGLWRTTLMAGAANLALGLAALALDAWARDATALASTDDLTAAPTRPLLRTLAAVMAVAGFASLAYEVIWTRVLGLLLGPSVYAFSIMLLAFLIGIALGGRVGGPLADRTLARRGLPGVLALLAAVEVGVAATSLALMWVYPELPYWYVWLFDWLDGENRPGAMWVVSTVTAVIATTPPAVLMGVAFPVAVRAATADARSLGAPVGLIYGANTLGGVAGAVVAGFVLLPTLQVAGAVTVAVAANVLAAVPLLVAARTAVDGRVLGAIGGLGLLTTALALSPPWDEEMMTSGMYHYVSHFEDHSREGIDHFSIHSYDLLYYREGLSTVLTVGRNHATNGLWMAHNGKVEASAEGDRPTQVLAGLLGLPFVDQPRSALVVGLASGITAGAVAHSPTLERIDIVEIERNTLEAARYFDPWSGAILDDPRVRLVFNDGRNHILLTPPKTYDLVVNQPSNPWISGVSNLFTAEFYAVGKERLRPGGAWVQWIQTYGMARSDLRSLLGTFADAFDHVLLFATESKGDLLLVGSDSPLAADLDTLRDFAHDPAYTDALDDIELSDPIVLLAHYQMGRQTLLDVAGPVERNTDDNMRVEYNAPRTVHTNTSILNVTLVEDDAIVPVAEVEADPGTLAALAREYRALGELRRAGQAMILAIAQLPEGDPQRGALEEELRRWDAP